MAGNRALETHRSNELVQGNLVQLMEAGQGGLCQNHAALLVAVG